MTDNQKILLAILITTLVIAIADSIRNYLNSTLDELSEASIDSQGNIVLPNKTTDREWDLDDEEVDKNHRI